MRTTFKHLTLTVHWTFSEQYLTFSEIGSGRIPAILNDEPEHDFVVESQIVLSNNKNYWIGGSAKTTGDIDFLHYFPYRIHSGEIHLSCQLND